MGEAISHTFGSLNSAPDHTIINKIYDYVSLILSNCKGRTDENENVITNRFCKTLNSKKPSEYPFFFHHQNLESDRENTSTDFAVFGTFPYAGENNIEDEDSPSLIKFEAKRLNSQLPKNREGEYVRGEYEQEKCLKNSGGIERFKNGRHGKDVTNAGMIGYIQTDSPKQWLQKINGWIKEQIRSASDKRLTWQSSDVLVLNKQTHMLSDYSSLSHRVFGDDIRMRHLWIDFSVEA